MKKTFVILIIFCFIMQTQAQTNSAILISFSGAGDCKRGSKIIELKFPILFNSGDKIKLQRGKAEFLLANSKEVNINSGIEYIVPKIKKAEMIVELDASVFQDFIIQSQSNSSITMLRGDSLSLSLYPISSKVTNIEKSEIIWHFDEEDASFDFELYDSNTLDLVFAKENFKSNKIGFNEMKLQQGNDYTWNLKIKNTKVEQLGIISILDKEDFEKIPKVDITNKLSIVKTYQYYVNNEFYFDAYNLMKQANEKFPKIGLFSFLITKMEGK